MDLLEKLNITNMNEFQVAMPNDIFTTLIEWKNDKKIKSAHIPFAYAYLYLTTYVYRYAKHSSGFISQSDFKEMLNYAPNNKLVDYMIKKNGLFDSENLTETTSNLPLEYTWIDDTNYNDTLDNVNIRCLDDFKVMLDGDIEWFKSKLGITNRSVCKKPLYGFKRGLGDIENNGTFYKSENTHLIDIRILNFCMQYDELGVSAFYIYSYIKHKNDIFGSYDASKERLSNELGLSAKTIQTYRDALRKFNMLELKHNMVTFNRYMNKDEYLAPTNKTNGFWLFVKEGDVKYEKFQDVINKNKEVSLKLKKGNHLKIDIDIDLLPF